MKNLKTTTALAIAAISLTANCAETKWVQTAFWKAPKVTEFKAQMKITGTIEQECAHFRKLMVAADGTPSWVTKYPEKVARFRVAAEPAFLSLESTGGNLEQEVNLKDFAPSQDDQLPHFTMTRAITGVNLENPVEFKIQAKEGSYTALSRDLGLSETGVEMIRDATGSLGVNIKGLDVACDLLNGNAHLEASVPSYVSLRKEDSSLLNEFYNERLAPSIRDLVSRKEGLPQKSMRLGFRTGKILEEEFPNLPAENAERQMVEVIKTLFHPKTLEPSTHFVQVGRQMMIHIESNVESSPVLVKLEI